MDQKPHGDSNPPPVTHHYDDIEEQDNPLPRWWLATFFLTIAFGVGYFYHYEVFRSGPTQLQELDREVTAAAEKAGKVAPVTAEQLTKLSADPAEAAEGRAIFATTCVPCHGENAEGKIGPNLTDGFWLHGGKPTDIYKDVSAGVADKGMPAWEMQLGHRKTMQVAAFVISLHGKNVPGKAPQGAPESGE